MVQSITQSIDGKWVGGFSTNLFLSQSNNQNQK